MAYFFNSFSTEALIVYIRDLLNMQRYKNIEGHSGVLAYETGTDYIKVRFTSGDNYLYTNEVTGSSKVQIMKRLAKEGRGLSTFISKYVKHKYVK